MATPITSGNDAVKSIYTNDIVSSFNILKPEKWDALMRSHGNQNAEYFNVINKLGFKVATTNESYSHFEDEWIHETVLAKAPIVVGAAGVVTTFTIDPANLDPDNNFYLRIKDQVLTQTGVLCYVTAIDISAPAVPVATIAPLDITAVATVIAGDEMAITSNAADEGTTQPEGRFSGTIEYTNNVQIIKETLSVTGTSMTDGLWFNSIEERGSDGKTSILGYYIKGQADAEYRMALHMEGACLFGVNNTNPTVAIDPDTGKAIKTTEGTYTYMESNGNIVNYTPGSFTVSKFNELDKIADKEVAPENYCAFLGIDIHHEFDDTFVDYNKDTNISFTKDITGGKKSLEIGFDFLKKGGRKYGFKKMQSFSNAKTYGAPGYGYSSQGLFIPLGRNKALDKNGRSESLPTIGMRYKALGSYNRYMETWDVSGAGNSRLVSAVDTRNLYLRSHIGSHNMVGNQTILLRP